MNNKLLIKAAMTILLAAPALAMAQAPDLGAAADFVLFSTNGGMLNTGLSQLTGNVGTNNGSVSGYGNVNGVMHNADGTTAAAAADLLLAYNQLNSTVAGYFPAPLLGNGDTLLPGVYSISAAATLTDTLTLNAQGNSNAVFIFQIQGTFATAAGSCVRIIKAGKACKVFWKVEGQVSMAAGTAMRGNVIANNSAIVMASGVTLEGRALSTTGAISTNNTTATTPIGCGSPILTGPAAPALASTACYALFSGNGEVTNSGVTHVTGDVGTNVGLTTGYNSLYVTGMIHPIPDASTAACAADLVDIYDHMNTLPVDIELLYPAQFGNDLVLTPHTYLLDAATTMTGTLSLNAMGKTDAVFVITVNGAFATAPSATVLLTNGAQAKNVYWKIDGAVHISDSSVFEGTIVCNNGAVSIDNGVALTGRALTTNGAMNTAAITAVIPASCLPAAIGGISGSPQQVIYFLRGDKIMIQVTSTTSANGSVQLYGMDGRKISSQPVSIVPGVNNYSIVQPRTAGLYFIYLTCNGVVLNQSKIMIR